MIIYITSPFSIALIREQLAPHCLQYYFHSHSHYLKYFISGTQVDSMITPKKLIKIARKWQKLPATRRKGMSFPRSFGHGDAVVCSRRPSMAEKGHFVVYSADGKRFVLPLAYLKNKIIRQLFRLAEEEFGLHSNGPLTLPCDANYMECVISLVRSHVSKDVEKAFIFPDLFRHYSKLSTLN